MLFCDRYINPIRRKNRNNPDSTRILGGSILISNLSRLSNESIRKTNGIPLKTMS